MLESVFTGLLNMSFTASVAAILVALARWMFGKKLPRIFSYALWAIVLLRLLIPFSLSSVFSIFNILPAPETLIAQNLKYPVTNNIPHSADNGGITQEETAAETLNANMGRPFPTAAPEAQADPKQALIFAISRIWLLGAAGLFFFSIYAYLRASQRLKEAVLYKHGDLMLQCSRMLKLNRKVQIYTSDRIHTPVVYGLIKVRIILPLDLAQGCSEFELKHIIMHELVHIKRFDYILKPISMLALCVHWFNPVIWAGYILSQKDMEMSCDEKVMSVFDSDIRSEYAASLIKLAAKQNILLNGGLLAFGESNIKRRIKEIMNFRKTGFWVGTAAVIILIVIGALLLTNGQSRNANKDGIDKNIIVSEQIDGFAWEIINRDIANYEANPEVKIKDSRITRLELINSFDTLGDMPIDVYALEYRILPEDLKKVVLAGGMEYDEEGWLKEKSSMGSPLLVVARKSGSAELIGTLWTGGILEEGGLEPSIKALLENYDESGNGGGSNSPEASGNTNSGKSNGENDNAGTNEIKFTDAFNGNIISPAVTGEMKEKLQSILASMKEMGPGVGPWRIIYCNGDKIILYNYSHIVACDITEKNKGIYSIIGLNDLKTGNYQGSIVAMIYPSPDAMACILGAACWEKDINVPQSLYLCSFYDGSVKELEVNYNIADNKVEWYRNMPSSVMLPWYVSIKGNGAGIIYDIASGKKIDSIPEGASLENAEEKFIENIELNTGYTYLFWWKADENTVIGAPYSKTADNSGELKLTDFEIIEVNLKDKSGRILYKINI